MGINSIHSAPSDFVWCKNTSNNTEFKCQVKTTNIERYRVVSQLDLKSVKIVLIIHGYCEVSLGNFIKVPFHDKVLVVKGVLPIFDDQLARKRKDYGNFKSETEVALS
ncbi:MAG: hypothetical protein NC310_00305 [Roseburia sp.]|nr:hypothetical protein [Anaeroplasma bactoclasticum]MCM1195494.1 hypothetical protein [Roseburia sp.]MCM1556872.1 hypothetical protein [Anaeroplasma bactoclasticum]